ncbi:MAG TPA: dodecin family protein [Chitinophagales bacterium]|nr:dodecin family protein [Chitinophagales bacterium]
MINKIIEVQSKSAKSWEDAAQQAVNEAAQTVKNIRSIWVRDFSAKVEKGKITEYRVDAKVTFEVMHEKEAVAH